MTHELVQTQIDLNTKIETSVDSYIFTCPDCNKQARYGYSFDNKQEVYCNGEDFGTKLDLQGGVVELIDAEYLKDIFITDKFKDEVDFEAGVLTQLELAGLVEQIPNTTNYQPTDKGYTILNEVRKEITLGENNVGRDAIETLREIYRLEAQFIVDLSRPIAREILDKTDILERAGMLNHISGIYNIDSEIIYEITQIGTDFIERIIAEEIQIQSDRIAKKVAQDIFNQSQ